MGLYIQESKIQYLWKIAHEVFEELEKYFKLVNKLIKKSLGRASRSLAQGTQHYGRLFHIKEQEYKSKLTTD